MRRLILFLTASSVLFGVTTLLLALRYDVPQKLWWRLSAVHGLPATAVLDRDYLRKIELFRSYSTERATIVMLGDSITAGADWGELLGRNDVVNRGIEGDTLEGMLTRIDLVIKLHPRYCFVMGGTNDLARGRTSREILDTLERLTTQLTAAGVTPVVESTLFVGTEGDARGSEPATNARDNPHIAELNREIRALAARHGFPFLDLNADLAPSGVLAAEHTYDGLHLRADAYHIWASRVVGFLRSQKI